MRTLAVYVFILLASTAANAQREVGSNRGTTFWIKYSLIFFDGCQPTVSPANIIFTRGTCSTNAYSGDILPRGTEVQMISFRKTKPFAIVSFKRGARDYQIALDNKSGKLFRNAFGLLFTKKKLNEFYDTNCPDNVRTKRQLIRCIGFPITVTRDGDTENYFYILEFVGMNSIGGSFDGFNVKIKRNKIIDISGYI